MTSQAMEITTTEGMSCPTATTLTVEQQIEEHYVRCLSDFPYYAEHCLKIQTMDSRLIPFKLNNVQRLLEEIISDIEFSGRLVRAYILKARREGISTWATGRFFWKTSCNKNKYTILVTHEPAATGFVFDMQKRYHKNLPPEFKPETKRNNVKMLQFDNDRGTGLDSAIRVGTAGVKDFGSSQLTHYIHLSEAAKYPKENAADLFISLFQTVPGEPNTAIIVESTAKGVGGEFYQGESTAKYIYEIFLNNGVVDWKMEINPQADPMSEFCSIFIPWFADDRYQMDVPEDFVHTAEEDKWAKQYGVNDRQLAWYRWCLANNCKGDRNKRSQEYPFNRREAYIGSGTPVFDIERILHFRDLCKPPEKRYEILPALGHFIENSEGRFQVWKEPEPAQPYVVSADVAEGLPHGDNSSASVWDHRTGEQVAHINCKCSPYEWAQLLVYIGHRYNGAWLVPERNNHGTGVVEELIRLEYPNVYMETIIEPPNKPRKRFGWLTSGKSRPLIIDTLVHAVSQEYPGINCADTYTEMLNFKVQDDGKQEADPGTHDDRVMDAAIGKYAMKTLPYVIDQNQKSNVINLGAQRAMVHTRTRPNKKAWT